MSELLVVHVNERWMLIDDLEEIALLGTRALAVDLALKHLAGKDANLTVHGKAGIIEGRATSRNGCIHQHGVLRD